MDAIVSIIIPAYNGEAHIERAVRCAQRQTLEALEILVVDDGSADGTSAVVERMAAADSRVKLFKHSENEGILASRRTGALNARGRYIAFLDADDELLPDTCMTLAQTMRASGAELIHFCAQYVLPEEGKLPQAVEALFMGEASGKGAWAGSLDGVELLDRFYIHKQLHWSVCSKFIDAGLAKRVYGMLGNERCDMAEDALTTFLLLVNARRVGYSGAPFYRYNLGSGLTSEMSPRKARAIAGEYRVYQLLCECLTPEQKENDAVRCALGALHDDLLDAVFWNLFHIENEQVLAEFVEALSAICTPFAFSRELQGYHAREKAREAENQARERAREAENQARERARQAEKLREWERHYLNDIETLRGELQRLERRTQEEHRQWAENEAHYLRDIAELKGEIERQANMSLLAQARERTKKRLSQKE